MRIQPAGQRAERGVLHVLGAALLMAWCASPAAADPGSSRTPDAATFPANPAAVRRAVEDLLATFGNAYPQGREYLERLTALEQSGTLDVARLAALQRDALLANPLLNFERLLLVRRVDRDGHAGMTPNWGGKTDIGKTGYDNEIAVLAPVRPDGTLTTLYRPAKGEFVGDVDLHWDAERLLFSMPGGKAGAWNVFELPLDPSLGRAAGDPRQVTPDLPEVESYDACYLPDGRIVFSSTAAQNDCPCWGRYASHSAAALYLLDRGSGRIRQLCFDQDHNWCPTVLEDGHVLYLRWEYTDTPHFFTRLLFAMNPDGTGQAALYGRNSYWPNAVFDARPVPGQASRLVGVVGGHHGSQRAGELVLFDTAQGEKEAEGVVQRIPGYGQRLEPVIRDQLVDASWPKFLHPWPLSDKHFLVSCKRDAQSPWLLCLADVFDNIVPIYGVGGSALLEPIPWRQRPRPPVIPDRVQLDRQDATVSIGDIYAGPGLAGVPRGTVKRLRVFAYHYAYHGTGGHEAVGTDGGWDVKRILGTVPVREDGSAHFRVPANTPLSLQPLDAEGKALQLMRSWFTAMPGEHVSCQGCHEPRAQASLAPSVPLPAADPSPITPWRGPARGFSFAREVQPVLDRYCVGCHHGGPLPAGAAVSDLRGGRVITPDYRDPALGILHPADCRCGIWHKWPINRSTSYEVLHRYVRRPGAESDFHLLPPLEYHADTSELVQLLRQGHHGVELDAEAWDRLVTWIDLNVPYHGNWGEYHLGTPGAAEHRREYARRFANLEDDPEWQPSLSAEPIQPVLPPAPARPAAAVGWVSDPTIRRGVLPPAPARPIAAEVRVPGWPFDAAQAAQRQRDAASALAGRDATATATEMKLDLGSGIELRLVLVPAGEFLLGDPAGGAEEQPATRSCIPRPFWMGKFEVTNRQFALFDPSHDSRYISVYGKDITYRGLAVNEPDQPVVRVPWTAAVEFCRWLSAKTGRRCSLPTESQWEWACRAGSAEPLAFGPVDADFSKWANLADRRFVLAGTDSFDWMPKVAAVDDGSCVTAAVGRYAPNAWGLYDMHGNAAEWTASLRQAYPDADEEERQDPKVSTGHNHRVVRGGSFADRPPRARSAFRLAYPAWSGVYNVGFRVVCEPD
jgi:formylglycine-generating enzyme required for sulfatase activity